MTVRYLLLLVGLFFCAPAYAAHQCYSPDEMQAEQLLRLHSELMVITVTCHQASDGQDLVSAYTGFTQANIKMLHKAEQIMANYYHASYGGNGIEQLDALRTRLGNEYGQKIADLSAPIFCQLYRDKVLQMCSVGSDKLIDEVHHMESSQHAYSTMCTAAGAPLAGKDQ